MKIEFTAADRLRLHFDVSEHETISSILKQRLWHIYPQELSSRLMTKPAQAYEFLGWLVRFETMARDAGLAWLVHIERPLGAIIEPVAPAPDWSIEFDESGAVWTISLKQMWMVSSSVPDSLTLPGKILEYMVGASYERVQELSSEMLSEERRARTEFETIAPPGPAAG